MKSKKCWLWKQTLKNNITRLSFTRMDPIERLHDLWISLIINFDTTIITSRGKDITFNWTNINPICIAYKTSMRMDGLLCKTLLSLSSWIGLFKIRVFFSTSRTLSRPKSYLTNRNGSPTFLLHLQRPCGSAKKVRVRP